MRCEQGGRSRVGDKTKQAYGPTGQWLALYLLLNPYTKFLDFLLNSRFNFTLFKRILHKESLQNESHKDARKQGKT